MNKSSWQKNDNRAELNNEDPSKIKMTGTNIPANTNWKAFYITTWTPRGRKRRRKRKKLVKSWYGTVGIKTVILVCRLAIRNTNRQFSTI